MFNILNQHNTKRIPFHNRTLITYIAIFKAVLNKCTAFFNQFQRKYKKSIFFSNNFLILLKSLISYIKYYRFVEYYFRIEFFGFINN
jgi:hypothetical protein